MSEPSERAAIGLCADCRFVRRLESAKGSSFYRCGRAKDDPRFSPYPPLPVVDCGGFEASEATATEP